MTDILGTKHESLKVLVARVLHHLPEAELMVVDWCDGDPYAISLALRSDPERRAYVSSVRDGKGLYFLSCEFTSRLDSEHSHNVEADPFADLAKLAIAIAEHLGPGSNALKPSAERDYS